MGPHLTFGWCSLDGREERPPEPVVRADEPEHEGTVDLGPGLLLHPRQVAFSEPHRPTFVTCVRGQAHPPADPLVFGS